QPRAERRDRGPEPGHPAAGHLSRAAGIHRLWHPDDHRGVRNRRASGARSDGGRRTGHEPAVDADLRRRHRPAAQPGRLRPGTGARLGDPRRGRRRLLSGRGRRGRRDGPGAPRRLPPGSGRRQGLRPALRRIPVTARPLRPRRKRRDAAVAGTPQRRPGRCAMTAAVLARLRETVCGLHRELTRYGLVAWTAGNVSARVPDEDLMVIKPSGVAYDDLSPTGMIVCDLYGRVVDGDLAPSSDTAAHAYVYRGMPEVGGVVHTHSVYATAWAARGEPI